MAVSLARLKVTVWSPAEFTGLSESNPAAKLWSSQYCDQHFLLWRAGLWLDFSYGVTGNYMCFNFLFFFLLVRAGTKGNWENQREGKVKLLLEQDSCKPPSPLVPSFLASCSALSSSFLVVGKVWVPHQQVGRERVLDVICDYPEESVGGAHQLKAQSKC